MSEEQDTIDQLRKLTCKYQNILLLKDYLLTFKKHFMHIAQKYLKFSAVTRNKDLVELFVKSLNTIFQDILNSRLSLLEKVKIDKFRRSRVKDSYNFEYVIQKVMELVSGKTIAWNLKQTSIVIFWKIRVDLDLRVLVIFSKNKTVWKVELSPDVESL